MNGLKFYWEKRRAGALHEEKDICETWWSFIGLFWREDLFIFDWVCYFGQIDWTGDLKWVVVITNLRKGDLSFIIYHLSWLGWIFGME